MADNGVDNEKERSKIQKVYWKAMESMARNVSTFSSTTSYNTRFWKRTASFIFDDVVHQCCPRHLDQFDGTICELHDCCLSTELASCSHYTEERYFRRQCRGCDSRSRPWTVQIKHGSFQFIQERGSVSFGGEEIPEMEKSDNPTCLVTEHTFVANQLCGECVNALKQQCEEKVRLLKQFPRHLQRFTGLPRELARMINDLCFRAREECFYCIPH